MYAISFYADEEAKSGAFRETMIVNNFLDGRTLKRIRAKAEKLGAKSFAAFQHIRTIKTDDI